MASCANCNADAPGGARICDSCGADLTAFGARVEGQGQQAQQGQGQPVQPVQPVQPGEPLPPPQQSQWTQPTQTPPPGQPPQPGQQWSQPQPSPYQFGTGPPAVPRIDPMAIISPILGGIGIFVCQIILAPAAIILGVISLKKISSSEGMVRGNGGAITGIILGGIGLVVGVVFLIAVIRNPDLLDQFRGF